MSLKISSEIKIDTDPCVLAWNNKLFVGAENGSIKCFDENLNPGKSWSAHAVQLFALVANESRVYSASNDGGIRIWSTEGEKLKELPATGADIGILHIYGNELYAGDEDGNVIIYENESQKASYNLLEEVKDLAVKPPFLFTVRDLDVTVTEIKPDESKNRFTMRHSMEGRAPLRVLGNFVLLVARDGNTLRIHNASADTNFKKIHEVKASKMILTSLSVSGDFAWTGGWDGCIRRWSISDNQLVAAGELDLGMCINSLVATSSNTVYAAVAGGRLVRINSA